MAVKLNTKTSIVDYLKSVGQNSSFDARKKLAQQYGITNYTGSAEQNTSLLKTLQIGSKPKAQQTAAPGANTNPQSAGPSVQQNVLPVQNVPPAVAQEMPKTQNNPIESTLIDDFMANPKTATNNQVPPMLEQNMPAQYQSPYSAQIDNLLNEILNRQPFSYDLNNDPMYKIYEENYTQAADRGMRDTIGNIASLTGGYGSSYAGVVGQQTYDNTMSQLNNMVPELYNLAYQQYMNKSNNDLNSLQALQSLENMTYGQYRDTMGDWQTNRAFEYGKERDIVGDQQWRESFDYGKERDIVGDQQWRESFDYGKERDTIDDMRYDDTTAYQRGQDALAREDYLDERTYNRKQDTIAREDYLDERIYQRNQDKENRDNSVEKYLNEIQSEQGEKAAKESKDRIKYYSDSIKDMLNAKDENDLGEKSNKYSISQVWDYLFNSGLSDDEIAAIANDIYELRLYIESMNKNSANTVNKSNSKFNKNIMLY